jgi:hypothetical protein
MKGIKVRGFVAAFTIAMAVAAHSLHAASLPELRPALTPQAISEPALAAGLSPAAITVAEISAGIAADTAFRALSTGAPQSVITAPLNAVIAVTVSERSDVTDVTGAGTASPTVNFTGISAALSGTGAVTVQTALIDASWVVPGLDTTDLTGNPGGSGTLNADERVLFLNVRNTPTMVLPVFDLYSGAAGGNEKTSTAVQPLGDEAVFSFNGLSGSLPH